MSLELKDGRYISCVWFVDSTDHKVDYLAYLAKDPGERWHVEYRFRYNREGKEDERSWYAFETGSRSEAEIVEVIDGVAAMTEEMYGGPIYKVRIESDKVDVALALLRKQKWFHVVAVETEPS